jgi:DHA3 family macrolide efflux protein-like MFS transporter
MWHVMLLTGSGTTVMAFTVAIMLPMFFIAPFGGVWADTFNRTNLINLADGFIAAVTLVIAIAFFLGLDNIWFLLVCSVARALGQGVQMPAVSSLIPQIVPQEHLLRVNGINTMIQSISMLGTPALAGFFYMLFPIRTILLFDVATASASILILIFFVRVANPRGEAHAAEERKPMLDDLKDGLVYIGGHLFLKRFFIIVACFTFLLSPPALLTPLQVIRNFGDDVWRLTVIEIAFSAGMVAGGLLITAWGGFKNKTIMIAVSFLISGLMGVGLGLTRHFVLYSIFMALIGVTAATSNTPALTILQQKVDPLYMGRVFSVMTMITSVVMPLGTAVFGPLADRISLDLIIIVTSAFIAVLGIYIFTDKLLKEAGRTD